MIRAVIGGLLLAVELATSGCLSVPTIRECTNGKHDFSVRHSTARQIEMIDVRVSFPGQRPWEGERLWEVVSALGPERVEISHLDYGVVPNGMRQSLPAYGKPREVRNGEEICVRLFFSCTVFFGIVTESEEKRFVKRGGRFEEVR